MLPLSSMDCCVLAFLLLLLTHQITKKKTTMQAIMAPTAVPAVARITPTFVPVPGLAVPVGFLADGCGVKEVMLKTEE